MSRLYHFILIGVQVLLDALMINLALFVSYTYNVAHDPTWPYKPPLREEVQEALLIFNIIFAATFWASNLYHLKRGASRVDETYAVLRAISITTVVIVALNTTFPVIGITNKVVVLGWILAMVLTSTARLLYRSLLGLLRRYGVDCRRVLIVGAEEIGLLVRRQLARAPWLGYHPVGFLSDTAPVGRQVEGIPVLGRRRSLPEIVLQERIDEVFIALSGASYSEVLALVGEIDDRRVGIKIYPDAFQIITHNSVSVDELSGLPLVSLRRVPLDQGLNRAIKRGMDVIIAGVILVLISPLMLLLAVLIRLESPGPVFFVQERVGLDGRPFKILKFRSMRSDAEVHSRWTRPDDDRRTRLGTIIRRFSLDELPQFINVMWGEMSVVGPRPEQPEFVQEFSESIPFYMHRHREKAGITGWAQVNGLRGDTSIEERTRYDLYYVENWSPLFDLKIILRTIVIIIRGAAY